LKNRKAKPKFGILFI